MEKQNIIFLDIDGVLNGYSRLTLLGWDIVTLTKSARLKRWYVKVTDPAGVHESKVKRLAKIIRETDAKVVMSSSWRFGWWNTPYEKQWEDQKKLTDLLNKYDIKVIDITPESSDFRRDTEILMWLEAHENQVKQFVVLDDESSDLTHFIGTHLVQTRSKNTCKTLLGKNMHLTGLLDRHVKEAIVILTR